MHKLKIFLLISLDQGASVLCVPRVNASMTSGFPSEALLFAHLQTSVGFCGILICDFLFSENW